MPQKCWVKVGGSQEDKKYLNTELVLLLQVVWSQQGSCCHELSRSPKSLDSASEAIVTANNVDKGWTNRSPALCVPDLFIYCLLPGREMIARIVWMSTVVSATSVKSTQPLVKCLENLLERSRKDFNLPQLPLHEVPALAGNYLQTLTFIFMCHFGR